MRTLQPEVTKSLHAAERALDAAREDRAQARRDRYAARQAHERAAIAAERLQQHVTELADRLDRMAELTSTSAPPAFHPADGALLLTSAPRAPYSHHEKTLIAGRSVRSAGLGWPS